MSNEPSTVLAATVEGITDCYLEADSEGEIYLILRRFKMTDGDNSTSKYFRIGREGQQRLYDLLDGQVKSLLQQPTQPKVNRHA